MSVPSDHRFLEGAFAPVTEEITAFDPGRHGRRRLR